MNLYRECVDCDVLNRMGFDCQTCDARGFMPVDLHTVGMIGKRVGLGINTVRVMSSRGDLPEPDLLLNTGEAFNRPLKLWLTETIDEWNRDRRKR